MTQMDGDTYEKILEDLDEDCEGIYDLTDALFKKAKIDRKAGAVNLRSKLAPFYKLFKELSQDLEVAAESLSEFYEQEEQEEDEEEEEEEDEQIRWEIWAKLKRVQDIDRLKARAKKMKERINERERKHLEECGCEYFACTWKMDRDNLRAVRHMSKEEISNYTVQKCSVSTSRPSK